ADGRGGGPGEQEEGGEGITAPVPARECRDADGGNRAQEAGGVAVRDAALEDRGLVLRGGSRAGARGVSGHDPRLGRARVFEVREVRPRGVRAARPDGTRALLAA